MYTDKKITTWYGKLVTPTNTFFVVHDKRVSTDEKGKILMYHSGREKVIPFVEDIVKDKLHDLTPEELAVAQKACDKIWNPILKSELKKQEKLFAAPSKKREEEPNFDDDDDDIELEGDSEFERLEDDDDDFDDDDNEYEE